MNRQRIFVRSVQEEFARERQAIRDYARSDSLLSQFFDVFLFEDCARMNDRVRKPEGKIQRRMIELIRHEALTW